jgi:hypothetical protein
VAAAVADQARHEPGATERLREQQLRE